MSDSAAVEKGKVFRPEIEGVRAVGALLVAVFHIWLRRVSGGVDVFFVISGFLLSTGLIAQVERTGSVQLGKFWSRLAERLLPAALAVLVFIVIFAMAYMPKSRWKETIEQVAAATVYVENWLLASRAVDYLGQREGVSPVQHFWALSVQAQFYLVWPLVFAVAIAIAHRSRLAFRSTLQVLLLSTFAASLAFSVYLTRAHQPLAYFNPFARVWEFCIGGLLALNLSRLRMSKWNAVIVGWIGLIAVLSCGALIQVSRVFPGYAALWPTLAAAAVIAAGNTGSRLGADRLLRARFMVYLGSIAYGIYLWHFPILIFCRMNAAPRDIGAGTGVAILIASVLLGAITREIVEKPAQRWCRASHKPGRALVLAGVMAAPLIMGIAVWTAAYFHIRRAESARVTLEDGSHPGAQALESDFHYDGGANVVLLPGPLDVAEDREIFAEPECNLPTSATVPGVCKIAGTDADFTIAVVGGSHSSQWLPALRDIASRAHWRILSFTKSNCPFYIGASVGEKANAACHEWNENVLKRLRLLSPGAVFTTATRFSDNDEYVPQEYINAWQALAHDKISVIALRDNPDFEFDVAACLEIHGANSEHCALPRNTLLEVPSPVALLIAPPSNVSFVDLSDYFCNQTTCPAAVGNVLVYRHMNHVTATYVRTLAPMLQRAMLQALDERARFKVSSPTVANRVN